MRVCPVDERWPAQWNSLNRCFKVARVASLPAVLGQLTSGTPGRADPPLMTIDDGAYYLTLVNQQDDHTGNLVIGIGDRVWGRDGAFFLSCHLGGKQNTLPDPRNVELMWHILSGGPTKLAPLGCSKIYGCCGEYIPGYGSTSIARVKASTNMDLSIT